MLVEQGTLLEDRLGNPAGALESFESAIKSDPMAIRGYMSLERRLTEDGVDPARLRRVLGGLAAATHDPARHAAILIDLARLESEAGDEGVARARELLDEALALELGSESGPAFAGSGAPASLDELDRLAQRAKRPAWRDEVLATRLRLLALDDVPRPASTDADAIRLSTGVLLLLQRAALAEERGDLEATIAHLEAAQALTPHDLVAERVIACDLREAALASGRWALVGQLALTAAEDAPPSLRGATYLEAIDAFERAGLVDETRNAVTRAEAAGLGELLEVRARRRAEADGDDEALVRSYVGEAERAIAAVEPGLASAALAKAAAIVGERLGRHDEAIAMHERALAIAPLGGLAEEHADALEWRYARLGRLDAWVTLVDKRLAAATDGNRRSILLARKAALLADGVGDLDGAIAAVRGLIDARPDEAWLGYELVALYRASGRGAEAAAALASVIARIEAPARKAELELERGALLAWHVGDLAAAEVAFREALRLVPGDGRATAALEELFDRRKGDAAPVQADATSEGPGRVDALVAALRAGLDAEPSSERASALLSRLAELHERDRHDARAAVAVFQELFERTVDPDEQVVAIRGMVRAYAALDDADSLIAALERELELLDDARSQAVQRARVAWQKERRGRSEAAEEDHREILEAGEGAPASVIAAARLGRLRAGYRAHDAAEIAEALGPLVAYVDAEHAGTRAALDLEHGAALAARDDHDAAAVVVARARQAQPESRGAQLAALMVAGRRRDARGLGSALAAIAEGLTSPVARASVLRRVGWNALVDGLNEDALGALQSASTLAPSDEAVVASGEAASETALAARAELAEGAARVPWLLALGEVQARAGELAAASATFEAVLAIAPQSLTALELDRKVRLAAGDRRGHAMRTLALGELVQEAERAAVLLAEAAEAFETLGDVEAAAYAYRETLARTPFDGAVYARARALLVRQAEGGENVDWAKGALLELYDHRCENVNDLPERIGVLVERAALYAGAEDLAHAERDLRSALELDPDDLEATWALARLSARDEARLEETRELFGALEGMALEPARRRAVAMLTADVEQRPTGDAERALVALERALEIDEDAATLRRYGALLLVQRHWQRAIDARRRLIPRVPPVEGAALEREIAGVYLDGFTDGAAAREAALRALRLDPSSAAAVELLARIVAGAKLSGEVALAVAHDAEDAARALLVEPERRGAALTQLRAIASLRGDAELTSLGGQLDAIFGARAVEARPVEALPPRPIDDSTRPILRAPAVDGVVRDLLAAVPELAAKLYPIDTKRMGKLRRLSTKQRATEAPALDEIARLVSASGFEVELGEGTTLQSDDARVVIGREVLATLPRALGRFRAARALTLFNDRLGVLERVDDAQLIALGVGCLALAKVPWPESLAALRPPAAALDAAGRTVDDAITRRERKAVLALAPQLGALPDPLRFRAAALASAARVGLFVAGDLSAVATELGPESAVELGRFAVSAQFLAARRLWRGEG
jgi:tetratricopeptide (TPR) repeat protein